MLYNVPIESLDERYSSQWNQWFPKEFDRLGVPYRTIYPRPVRNKISHGEFLDVVGTNIFKSQQMYQLLFLIDQGEIKDNDVIFFHDIWFPGLEALFYVRDGLKLKFKIAGCLHAGTYDDWDFVTRCGMGRWGANIETAWFSEVDLIFVATFFHRQKLLHVRDQIPPDKVHRTGFPLAPPPYYVTPKGKENIIVFPHRLTPDKAPQEFDQLMNKVLPQLPGWTVIKTHEQKYPKVDYYRLLAHAKIAVSTAYHEFWGIAQQEAMFLGCVPVVPDRLSYRELYPSMYRYDGVQQAADRIVWAANNHDRIIHSEMFKDTVTALQSDNAAAIGRMIGHMRVRDWNVMS